MKRYEKTSIIRCGVQELFDFHCDLNNIPIITPKDTKVSLVGEVFTPTRGSIIKLNTVKNFIPMVWVVEVQELTSPNLLVDVALKSPFSYWKHAHVFTDMGDGTCELKDIVEYVAPLGFVGRWFDCIVRHELEKMFTYRHQVTNEMLGERR